MSSMTGLCDPPDPLWESGVEKSFDATPLFLTQKVERRFVLEGGFFVATFRSTSEVSIQIHLRDATLNQSSLQDSLAGFEYRLEKFVREVIQNEQKKSQDQDFSLGGKLIVDDRGELLAVYLVANDPKPREYVFGSYDGLVYFTSLVRRELAKLYGVLVSLDRRHYKPNKIEQVWPVIAQEYYPGLLKECLPDWDFRPGDSCIVLVKR